MGSRKLIPSEQEMHDLPWDHGNLSRIAARLGYAQNKTRSQSYQIY
jgi:hypothetical protein